MDWKNHTEDGSGWVGGAGPVGDAAALLFYEATRNPEAEAGADRKLGGEEGREYSRARGGGDAGALPVLASGRVVVANS